MPLVWQRDFCQPANEASLQFPHEVVSLAANDKQMRFRCPLPMIIAIDGPAASGKGTLAKRIAAHFRLPHLDTGLLYRAVGRQLLDRSLSLDDADAAAGIARELSIDWLVDERLRLDESGKAASRIAVVPAVRAALKEFQVDFAHQDGGAVLDGRDIGTVIAPDAHVKIWVVAAPEVRARRRWLELSQKDSSADEAQILADLKARDARDAPNMIRAYDAVTLDTSLLDRDQSLAAAIAIVERAKAAERLTR
jgi:CMP/dCMP kinase